ncbi:MAG: 30S ribosomal protein S20 [Dehalococcoidia bacterium]|nr:MAG: 30S ribosomal protein S20 [Dehalococcoidia bacterium]
MPSTKSAKKQIRVNQRKRLRNKSARSQGKTLIKKAEELILSGKIKEAEGGVVAVVSSLDKAAEKGIIHSNNAARRKSRLLKKLNQAKFESVAE